MATQALKTQGEVLLYKSEKGEMSLQVQLQNDTVWLTQAQMAELFGKGGLLLLNTYSTFLKKGS